MAYNIHLFMEITKLCSIINQMKAKMNREHESGKVKVEKWKQKQKVILLLDFRHGWRVLGADMLLSEGKGGGKESGSKRNRISKIYNQQSETIFYSHRKGGLTSPGDPIHPSHPYTYSTTTVLHPSKYCGKKSNMIQVRCGLSDNIRFWDNLGYLR